ncbi:MAG: hypothetical protein DI535_11845 [Citrobacter freundii]|nr:MAG: hypothetical protein DI535_11845 [Citrobacter freundii]
MILELLYYSCLLISTITATALWRSLKSRQLFLFVPYLWWVTIQEYGLLILTEMNVLTSTGIYYNIYRPVCTTAFAATFYHLSINAPVKKLIGWIFAVYLLVTFTTFIFINPITVYNSYLSLASGFTITCCAIFFLFNYFNLDNSEEEKKWLPVVVISMGMIAFYPVVNISFAFYKHLLKNSAFVFGTKLYQSIPQLMSVFMYSCFTYAFYLCKKKN